MKLTKEFIIYGLIGALGLAIDFGFFTIFVNLLKINLQIANFSSSSLALVSNFYLNSHFNFKTTDKWLIRFISYYLIGQISTVIVGISLYVFVTNLGFNKILIKIIATGVSIIIQFGFNKVLTFKKKPIKIES